uniref:Hexosyltransferase n=1 Tax=Parascaris univalens TaxID=6257 RepID=A0A914ZEC9_PARUN
VLLPVVYIAEYVLFYLRTFDLLSVTLQGTVNRNISSPIHDNVSGCFIHLTSITLTMLVYFISNGGNHLLPKEL